MTEKELKHLSRKELIEILIDKTKEINSLEGKIERLEAEANNKRVLIEKSGSMAEAAIKLNGLFEDADKAAKQYIENARQCEEKNRWILEETKKWAKKTIIEAETIKNRRIAEGNRYKEKVMNDIRSYILAHPEVRKAVEQKNRES